MSDSTIKFSLRDVFFKHRPDVSPGDTDRLLESYGIQPINDDISNLSEPIEDLADAPEAEDPTCVRLLEMIEDTIFDSDKSNSINSIDGTSESQQSEKLSKANRDDLALVRWRKMAGL